MIKEWFANYRLHTADVTFRLRSDVVNVHRSDTEDWSVTSVDTGELTMTGGRLKRVKQYLADGETFAMTYGDGLADIDITAELAFHRAESREATVAAVVPPGRFGAIEIEANSATAFAEKPPGDRNVVNGGFFLLEPSIFDLIDDDTTAQYMNSSI